LKQDLKDIIQQLKSIEISQKHLRKLQEVRVLYCVELDDLKRSISKSSSFIESLDRVSFYSIYSKLLRTREANLSMHKRYFLEQSLKYNELLKALELLDFEIEILTNKVLKLSQIKKKFKKIIEERNIKIRNINVIKFRNLVTSIDRKLILIKEIEEAIAQGVTLNKILNKTINHLKKEAHRIFKSFKNEEILKAYDISKLQKYQQNLVSIKHGLIKYEIEIEDVYKELLNSRDYDNSLVSTFVQEYRINLLNDLTSTTELNSSFIYLKNFKSVIMSLTRNLRSDLKKLKKELIELERNELDMLLEMGKEYSM